jgi:cyanophycin synthetase
VTSLVELRVLEGPNLYFPRAAVKLTLDVSAITEAGEEPVLRLARRIGLRTTRPGAAGTGFRQRFALRAVERLVRAIAAEAGTRRLAVRVRPTADPDVLVVAFPWRDRSAREVEVRAFEDAQLDE